MPEVHPPSDAAAAASSSATAVPTGLVEAGVRRYGRFAGRPARVNPLDEFRGLTRRLRRTRLKEWVGFTLLHADWYASLIMQDAQYLASSEIYAYDRERRVLHQRAAHARGGTLALPVSLPESRCTFAARDYRLSYDFSAKRGRHTLRFEIPDAAAGASPQAAAGFEGELTLDARRASAPLSVSARLPGRGSGGRMFTHKAVFPVEGALRVGDREIVFDGARDLAILDEHKSLLPYRTDWLWGTFALPAADGRAVPVGANFAARPGLPGEADESCLWTAHGCEPLTGVDFGQGPPDPGSARRVASRDGRLDVVFEPEGRKRVRHQLGLFAIDYFQAFGRYHGTLRGAAGEEYAVSGVHGVFESMRARL
jgi:hypothetical protein